MNPVKKHSNTLFKPLSEINNVLHTSADSKYEQFWRHSEYH